MAIVERGLSRLLETECEIIVSLHFDADFCQGAC
jgi:hypothetical protein